MHGVGVCQCTEKRAHVQQGLVIRTEQLNFVACRDSWMLVMEGRARPPRDDDRYSEHNEAF